MRTLLLTLVLLAMVRRADADCFGVGAYWGPPVASVHGEIVGLVWGPPLIYKCPDGKARCFEQALALSGEPRRVRIVLANIEHRDVHGAKYKLKRLVLEGALPTHYTECSVPPIALGDIREFHVEARTAAPWRVTGAGN